MRFPAILAALLLSACATTQSPPPTSPFGAQLYTVREAMEADPLATLQRVAELGYGEVEFAGTFGATPAALCAESRRLGVGVAAAHAEWQQLRDDPQAALSSTKALCTDTMILAWLPPEERATLDQWRGWIATLNAIVPLAREQGLSIAYHAHDFEFMPIDGVRPIDLLMRDLDPAIGFELDTYWAARAGVDPLAFLQEHADRVTHLHLKDMTPDGGMADVGAGTLDLAAIIAQARRQGVEHFLVERDDAPDPWASLATSLDSLRAMPLQRRNLSTASGSAIP